MMTTRLNMTISAMANKKTVCITAALAAVFFLCAFPAVAGAANAPAVNAPRANAAASMLMDAGTTRVLASLNAHARLPMASTTKVMTALVALENCALDALVTVDERAYAMEGSSMYLRLGEKLTLEDLLYGLMLSSGNDAAVAIAVHVGGSAEGFGQLMNTRAATIGCANTNFVTPNGLHDANHYTSAYDLALITCEAIGNEAFRTIVGTQYWVCKSGEVARTLKNKNKLLWNFNGGNGVKTGYTQDAGKCLVFSAERDGNTVVGVLLNCPDMWKDAAAYLNYGFDHFTWELIAAADETMAQVKVQYGLKNSLALTVNEDILVPLREDETLEAVTVKLKCPRTLEAPVYAGQSVGTMEAYADGRLLKSVPLVAA
ncbi:MAG: D-alanyl-D-alanine carboxypeptidase, partial [Clostridiales bacterium]|nr:D-alanyl-D-alanine carboxypeptidase [Clostridiales bacterium]